MYPRRLTSRQDRLRPLRQPELQCSIHPGANTSVGDGRETFRVCLGFSGGRVWELRRDSHHRLEQEVG